MAEQPGPEEAPISDEQRRFLEENGFVPGRLRGVPGMFVRKIVDDLKLVFFETRGFVALITSLSQLSKSDKNSGDAGADQGSG